MEQIYTEFDLSTFRSAEFTMLHKRNSQLLQEGEQEQHVLAGVAFPAMPSSVQIIPHCGSKGACSHLGQMRCKSPKSCSAFPEMVSASKFGVVGS